MLEKNIKQVMKKKIKDWLGSIDDEDVKIAIERDLVISGGAITSLILNEVPNDYDVYFRTKETTLKVAQYYADRWNSDHGGQQNKLGKHCNVMVLDCDNPSKEILDYFDVNSLNDSRAVMLSNVEEGRIKMIFPSDGVVGDLSEEEEIGASENLGMTADELMDAVDDVSAEDAEKEKKEPYTPVFISSNAITLTDGVQIVVRFYGEPDTIHENYDFTHTKAFYDFGNSELSVPAKVYECVINKRLEYTGSKYPVATMFRMRKFIERGWRINAGQILKVCMQISALDLTDINVLEDQLIGVDTVYFMNIIDAFRRKQMNDPDFQLTTGYILSVVDKVF